MRKYYKKKIVIIVLFFISLICSSCVAEDMTTDIQILVTEGFRGVKWGQKIVPNNTFESLLGHLGISIGEWKLLYNNSKEKMKIYERKNDQKEYGDVTLDFVKYCFYDEKFSFVDIFTKGKENASKLFIELEKKYGIPAKQGESDIYIVKAWVFGDVEIRHFYDKREDACSLYFLYVPLSDAIWGKVL